MGEKYKKPLFVNMPFEEFVNRLCKVSKEEIDKLIAKKAEDGKNS